MSDDLLDRKCVCGVSYTLQRDNLRYWPDELWPGKIQAHYQCPSCGDRKCIWAHELPEEWHSDWLRFKWEDYAMKRLLFSMQLHGIEPIPGPIKRLDTLKMWWVKFAGKIVPAKHAMKKHF